MPWYQLYCDKAVRRAEETRTYGWSRPCTVNRHSKEKILNLHHRSVGGELVKITPQWSLILKKKIKHIQCMLVVNPECPGSILILILLFTSGILGNTVVSPSQVLWFESQPSLEVSIMVIACLF